MSSPGTAHVKVSGWVSCRVYRRAAGVATLAAVVALLAACSGTDTLSPGEETPDPWIAVDSVVQAQLAQRGRSSNLTLTVYNRRDERVFEKSYGNFSPDRRVAVASASKLIAAMVLLDVVATGELSLESTTGEVLGWTLPNQDITLRHLLSFTSGLQNENECTFIPGTTLASCVANIRARNTLSQPAQRFDYGSTHLHVAARMAEVATGKSWQALFRERVADRLELPSEVRFFTLPNLAIGESNPLVAGGLRASAREYGAMLALAFHNGANDGVVVANSALFDAQAREPYPSVFIGNSPYAAATPSFRYGLGGWLECATPAQGCDVVSSAGLFGFTPWFDRAAGYYATLAMEETTAGGALFSVQLQQAVMPFVRRAIQSAR